MGDDMYAIPDVKITKKNEQGTSKGMSYKLWGQSMKRDVHFRSCYWK